MTRQTNHRQAGIGLGRLIVNVAAAAPACSKNLGNLCMVAFSYLPEDLSIVIEDPEKQSWRIGCDVRICEDHCEASLT